MIPINIDLSGLRQQFGISAQQVDDVIELCVNEVSALVYTTWQALAKQRLKSTLPEYLQNLKFVDRGRFAKQIILGGILPTMIENGASAFDMKEGFKKSSKIKTTVPIYNRKGVMISPGGAWYISIPFRQGNPDALGQAGFANIMPDEVYAVAKGKGTNEPMTKAEIPSPFDEQLTRGAIKVPQSNVILFDEYKHKNSIYEGLRKETGVYAKVNQNTYVSFRRAGENSDPLSWIHKGFQAYRLSDEAVERTDVDGIVDAEVTKYLDATL